MTSDHISPEQRLFVGVLANAAQEAAGGLTMPDRGKNPTAAQDDARAWFVEAGDDFVTVCELAGFEPDHVRARVLAYLERVDGNPSARAKTRRMTMPARRRAVSIADVARQAGVSTTTVSNVIHDRPNISPTKRKTVLAAIDALGYRQHVH